MAVKTIATIAAGHEILVDYGGRYFEADSSDDSDMHASDEEFQFARKDSAHKRQARERALGGGRSGKGRGARAATTAAAKGGKKRRQADAGGDGD